MRHLWALSLGFLCLGCEEAVPAATQIKHLQIVSVVADPPEVEPRETTDITVTIADPDGLNPEVAVWVCVPFGDAGRCLESELTGEAQRVVTGPRDSTTHAFTATVVPLAIDIAEVDEILDAGGAFRGILAFALACAPGACPLFDQLDNGTVDPIDLSDPSRLLRHVPMSKAHAAWRTLAVTREDPQFRQSNPVLLPQFTAPLEVKAGDTRELNVAVDGQFSDGLIYPLTTVGGFAEHAVSTGPEPPVLPWVTAKSDAGKDGHVYIVVDDGSGGQAVWFGEASAR